MKDIELEALKFLIDTRKNSYACDDDTFFLEAERIIVSELKLRGVMPLE